mmetsp:Transcript_25086/g.22804  ORF Transcript_25086/g.22804 Transcript_25086/m.22804 type:complete len:84 (-) Transcript_25086:1807-2058(-)
MSFKTYSNRLANAGLICNIRPNRSHSNSAFWQLIISLNKSLRRTVRAALKKLSGDISHCASNRIHPALRSLTPTTILYGNMDD